jgi:UDPglucose 6-dehydrogenase
VCVVGAGHVGLVTAAVFADLGNDVVCLDIDQDKIAALQDGQVPIFEPGLSEMVLRNQGAGRLTLTSSYPEAVPGAEVVFLAVDTPTGSDGRADLTNLRAATAELAQHLSDEALVVVKSTVPVGSGSIVRTILEENCRPERAFEVASCPEFLREGSAVADCLRPDRVVIGCSDPETVAPLVRLYAPLERPLLFMDVNSAELVKYAANSFLAMRISFVNSIADLCEEMDADIGQVIKGISADTRIGGHYLSPGLGYGGSCFPKDTAALASFSAEAGCPFTIIEAVMEVNRQRIPRFIGRLHNVLGDLKGREIAVLGLSFKPDTEDVRESRSLELVQALLAEGARVRAYDPVAVPAARRVVRDVRYCSNAYEAADGADALVIATEWNEFKLLDLERMGDLLRQRIIFDGRNTYSPSEMKDLGFQYVSVGR